MSSNAANPRVSLSAAAAVVASSGCTGGPLSAPLRTAINARLLSSGAIPAIHEALLHECQATGFLQAVRTRVLELLRSGECVTYGECMERVLGEIKGGKRAEEETGAMVNGNGNGNGNGNRGVGGGDGLRIPRRVVEEGVRVVRASLEGVVEVAAEEGRVAVA